MDHFFNHDCRKDTPPAIVTNAKNRIAYNIVRSLGQKGIPVFTADFVPRSMSFASNYSKGHFRYPSPFRDQKGFIDCLLEWTNSVKDCVLIPVFEETFLISKFKDRLIGNCKMIIPDYHQILVAHNKDRWQPLAHQLGIPCPETYPLENLRQNLHSLRDLRYPVLIKPKQGGGGWAIIQVNTAMELETLLSQDSNNRLPWDRFFLQQKIMGETHCVAMLFNRGGLRAQITYKQLREYPIAGGQATLRVSLRNVDAETNLRLLLESLAWHGICQADFVVEKETGISYLIDINPRFWGSLVQALASEVDFPYLLYRIAVDGDVEPVTSFRTGVRTRWLGGDIRTFFPLIQVADRKLEFIREFFFPRSKNELFDDFSWQDPLPFCAWCLDAIVRVIKHHSFEPVSHDSLEGIWE
jgi:predicted ATP-grasp superfamily ATP-dependent carboligase